MMLLSTISRLVGMVGAADTDTTNRPLAIATIVVSVVAIVATVVYLLRTRGRGAEVVSDDVLAAVGAVEWYADEVGADLLAADQADRAALLEKVSHRVEGAQAQLVSLADSTDDQDWNSLMVELAAAQNAYANFAHSDQPDPGSVRQHQHVLKELAARFGDKVTSS